MSTERENQSNETGEVPGPEDPEGGNADAEAKETPVESKDDMVSLPPGEALTPESALVLTRARDIRLIVLAGAVGSGKTTLLASIYECFQDGPFAGYLFAGSRTLLGLEQRCHLARLASGGTRPETDRTTLEETYRLLHLRVRQTSLDEPAQDLLFTDLSGELFRAMRDSTEECRRHKIFLRADRFVLLVDGEKLCSRLARDSAVADAASLLRRCIDAGILGKHSLVDVLFAKADRFLTSGSEDAEVTAFLNRTRETKFEDPFKAKLGSLVFTRVAARPDPAHGGGLGRGHGLPPLFRSWVDECPTTRNVRGSEMPEAHAYREVDRFRATPG